MKKVLYLCLISIVLLGTTACGKIKENENNDKNNNGTNAGETEKENTNKEPSEINIEILKNLKETSKDEFVYFAYEGVAYITEFIGESEYVIIPNEIDGNPVVEISNTAFRNNRNVKAVKIGDNVKKIGKGVFANCSSLEYVLFGKSVETIGESAFVGCASMKEIRLNEGLVSVGKLAICNTEVPTIIPKSVTEIGPSGLSQPVKVYKGSYAEQYITNYAANYGAPFQYEVIE